MHTRVLHRPVDQVRVDNLEYDVLPSPAVMHLDIRADSASPETPEHLAGRRGTRGQNDLIQTVAILKVEHIDAPSRSGYLQTKVADRASLLATNLVEVLRLFDSRGERDRCLAFLPRARVGRRVPRCRLGRLIPPGNSTVARCHRGLLTTRSIGGGSLLKWVAHGNTTGRCEQRSKSRKCFRTPTIHCAYLANNIVGNRSGSFDPLAELLFNSMRSLFNLLACSTVS